MMTFHDDLKNLLVEIGKSAVDSKGKPYFDRSYSGDSEPIDVRRGMKSVEYPPDVIWKKTGRLFMIEVALNENWRSIVGEFALAKIVNCWGILFITDFEENFFSSLISVLEKGFGFKRWYYYLLDEKNFKDIDNTAKEIVKFLKNRKFKGWKK